MAAPIFPTAQDAENAFYDALARGDVELMMAVWADDEEIICVHHGGPRFTGQEQVRDSWHKALGGGSAVLGVHVTQLVALSGPMVAVHSVQENLTPPGEAKPRAPVVATNVYLRTAAGWRMVAHHASPAPGKPDTPQAMPAGPKTLH